MKVSTLNDNWDKVCTKEQLLEILKKYGGILTKPMLDYLNSLIELEFSVAKDYISDSDRKILAELEIYKKVAIYNIYNRIINLFKEQNGDFIISGNNDRIRGLTISTKLLDRSVKLFDFGYENIYYKGLNIDKMSSGFKTLNIGEISLFQTLENKELREAELDRVMRKLESLYDARNPYMSRPGVVGGPGANWVLNRAEKIREYEERFNQLDGKELSYEDTKEIEITGQAYNLLLEEFGLTTESFEDQSNQIFANFGEEETKLNKTLIKRMTNLTIKTNIKYI